MTTQPPNFEFIAAQLRKPSGGFAANIAQNMDRTNQPLFELVLQSMDLRDGHSLLEIGFGSGRFIQQLCAPGRRLNVSGIDYSPDMVAMARGLNAGLIQAGSLRLDEGSSERLPFDDDAFDAVVANMVIYFWDDPAQHLAEIRRVLKPGGTFYTGFRPAASMRQYPFVKFGFTLYEPGEWQALLERNGFQIVKTDRRADPEMETNGQKIQLDSVCMAARK